MKNRAVVPIVVMLAAGGIGFYIWYTGQQGRPSEGNYRVVVAKTDIDRLSKVDLAAQFDLTDWPKSLDLPAGAMTVETVRTSPNEPERTVYRTIVGNEEVPKMAERSFVSAAFKKMPITVGMLSEPGQSVNSTQLKPGMVAVSVNVEEASSVSGLVKPGSRVNVLTTNHIDDPRTHEQADVCVTVLRDVEIFAVGGIIQPKGVQKEGDKPVVARTITLQVTPEQAKIITLLADRGKITMELVSAKPGEAPEPSRDPPMTMAQALEKSGYRQNKEKEPEVKDVRLIEGILKAIANTPAAPAAPGAKASEVVMALPTPTPKPVVVTLFGPNRTKIDEVTFSSYDATEPTSEYKKNMTPYSFPPQSAPPSAPIGSNPPPIAPSGNPPPVQ